MANPIVTWSIDSSSTSVISVGAGILTASLSDNVQAFALLACEKYGANLAMCEDTCGKIERLAIQKERSPFLARAGLVIGFSPLDCASQLASNQAGLRFLALVPVLMSVGSNYKAAEYLHALLDKTSPQKQLLPTVRQLKELFNVLEEKLSLSHFTDSVVVWDMILQSTEVGLVSPPLPVEVEPSSPTVPAEEATSPASSDQPIGRPPDIPSFSGLINNPRINSIRSELEDSPSTQPSTSAEILDLFSLRGIGMNALFSGIWNLGGGNPVQETYQHSASGSMNSHCPSPSQVSAIIQAMSEMARIGTVSLTFAIIRTPLKTAAWVIAFVRWCLGVEPYIRTALRKRIVLKQSKSSFLVEIGDDEHADREFSVRTFNSLGHIEQLLWKHESKVSKLPETWGGMMRVKGYFRTRIQKLRSRCQIFCLPETFLSLASRVGDSIKFAHASQNPLLMTGHVPFPSSEELVELVAKYVGIQNHSQELQRIQISKLNQFWNDKEPGVRKYVVDIFNEMLLSSLVDNVHFEDDPRLFVDTGGITRVYANTSDRNFRRDMEEVLTGESINFVRVQQLLIEQSLSRLLGFPNPKSTHVIQTSKGQVLFSSYLEELDLSNPCLLRKRVLFGALRYNEQRYTNMLGDPFNHEIEQLVTTKASGNETSTDASTSFESVQNTSTWMISQADEDLVAYWVPNPDLEVSVEFSQGLQVAGKTIFLDKCNQTPCPQLLPDLVYCTTIAASLSRETFEKFRILRCNSKANNFLARSVLGASDALETNGKGYKKTPKENVDIIIACGSACLACACQMGVEALEHFGEKANSAKVIIITAGR